MATYTIDGGSSARPTDWATALREDGGLSGGGGLAGGSTVQVDNPHGAAGGFVTVDSANALNGGTWTLSDLALQDGVTLTIDAGYSVGVIAPLESAATVAFGGTGSIIDVLGNLSVDTQQADGVLDFSYISAATGTVNVSGSGNYDYLGSNSSQTINISGGVATIRGPDNNITLNISGGTFNLGAPINEGAGHELSTTESGVIASMTGGTVNIAATDYAFSSHTGPIDGGTLNVTGPGATGSLVIEGGAVNVSGLTSDLDIAVNQGSLTQSGDASGATTVGPQGHAIIQGADTGTIDIKGGVVVAQGSGVSGALHLQGGTLIVDTLAVGSLTGPETITPGFSGLMSGLGAGGQIDVGGNLYFSPQGETTNHFVSSTITPTSITLNFVYETNNVSETINFASTAGLIVHNGVITDSSTDTLTASSGAGPDWEATPAAWSLHATPNSSSVAHIQPVAGQATGQATLGATSPQSVTVGALTMVSGTTLTIEHGSSLTITAAPQSAQGGAGSVINVHDASLTIGSAPIEQAGSVLGSDTVRSIDPTESTPLLAVATGTVNVYSDGPAAEYSLYGGDSSQTINLNVTASGGATTFNESGADNTNTVTVGANATFNDSATWDHDTVTVNGGGAFVEQNVLPHLTLIVGGVTDPGTNILNQGGLTGLETPGLSATSAATPTHANTITVNGGGHATDTGTYNSDAVTVNSGGVYADTGDNTGGGLKSGLPVGPSNPANANQDTITVNAGGRAYEEGTHNQDTVTVEGGGSFTETSTAMGPGFANASHDSTQVTVEAGGVATDNGTYNTDTVVLNGGSFQDAGSHNADTVTVNAGGKDGVSGSDNADKVTVNGGQSMDSGSHNALLVTVNAGGSFTDHGSQNADTVAVNTGGHGVTAGTGNADNVTVGSGGVFTDQGSHSADNVTVESGGAFTGHGQEADDTVTVLTGGQASETGANAAGLVHLQGGTLTENGQGATTTVDMSGGGKLVIEQTFGGTVENFGPGGAIGTANGVQGFSFALGASAQDGILTVHDAGGQTFSIALDLNVGVTASELEIVNGEVVVCFASGTLIATTRGQVAVERLAVGDLVVTAGGEARPIVWLGHKRIERPTPAQLPVRVMAGAFGENLPRRDLLLSPGHAVCVDVLGEVFVPVSVLVDGASIAPVEVAEVSYWHVELASHDVLLAEGLGCESYMDAGNRAFFGREYGRLAEIDAERVADSLTRYARPFVDHGTIIEAIRQRLAARAEILARSMDQGLAA